MPSPLSMRHEDRMLTIISKDGAAIKFATKMVEEWLTHLKNMFSAVKVSKNTLYVAMSVKKVAANGMQFHFVEGKKIDELQVVSTVAITTNASLSWKKLSIYWTNSMSIIILLAFARSIIEALIGMSGANIRAL